MKKIILLVAFFVASHIYAQPGSIDASFLPTPGTNGAVFATAVQSDGKYLVGGGFTVANGTSRVRLARYNADGTLDTGFTIGTGFNDNIRAVRVQSTGKIIVGGVFTTYNGLTYNRIVRLNADGSLDASFNAGGAGFGNEVRAISIQSDDKIVVGGTFIFFNGVTQNRITRLNSDGTLDTTFNVGGSGANNSVQSTTIQTDGKIIIGGTFVNYNGFPRSRVARLNTNGSIDSGFSSPTANAGVQFTEQQLDGKIIISGNFTNFGGDGNLKYIVRVNSDGTIDTTFNVADGPDDIVRTTAVQPDGKIIVGGNFLNFNLQPRSRLARLNSNGSLDATFNPAGTNNDVETTTLLADGKILLSGTFTNYNGVARNRIARIFAYNSISISSLSQPTPICQNFTLNLNYTVLGSYGSGNIFTAQLSNSAGSFALPVAIGSLTSTTNGTISITIPANTPPASGYRIRVVSSNPAITGFDNGSDITVLLGDFWYADADGDGFGNPSISTVACIQPVGYVLNNTDCVDTDATINPAATDVCYDGIDNDCNGIIDNVGQPGGCTPIVSTVQASQCGTNLTTIDQDIIANLVTNVQGYRFRVTNLTTSQVQTIDKLVRVFKITQLPNYAFNTTYQVEVAVRFNNVWQPFYGTPCTITTPEPTTQLQASQCSSTLMTMADVILANNVPFASGYRFKITNIATSQVQTIDRNLREFRMNLFSSPALLFNTAYSVEVAVKNTNGVFMSYGLPCTVTTPNFPTTKLQPSQCGFVATSLSELIFANVFSGATAYKFIVTGPNGYNSELIKSLRVFSLDMLPTLLTGTNYTVGVQLQINGVFGPTGDLCSVTTPGATPSFVKEAIIVENNNNKLVKSSIVAYPNPFNNTFKLTTTNSNKGKVQIRVYDMLGKIVDDRQLISSELENIEIGANYPAGVYNVILSQDEKIETLRIVKR